MRRRVAGDRGSRSRRIAARCRIVLSLARTREAGLRNPGGLHRPMTTSIFSPTPTHTMRLEGPSDWPAPPFASGNPWGEDEGPLHVRIETRRGVAVEGQMLGFDLKRGSLIFRFDQHGSALRVQFRRFRRLTVLEPLPSTPAGAEIKLAFAAQLRKFKIALVGDKRLDGRTAGHVETRDGLFMFTPDDEERTLHRSFVPASAYTRCVMGPSVEEDAALRWVTTPLDLTAKLESAQQQRRVLAIGEAIYDLGVISARQLAMMLESQGTPSSAPLGEMLVGAGLLSRADLRTALGHKMGYPLVDLQRFPLNPAVLERMPPEVALECNALPLMMRGPDLVVAVDNLARVAQLAAHPALMGTRIVPVLARQSQVEGAIVRAYHDFGSSVWGSPHQGWRLTEPSKAL
jgi:hypothetical protein